MKIVLEQRQMLKMVMTTELRQAIELLQLSTYELKQFIQKQAEENPFIELIEKDNYSSNYKKRSFRTGNEVDPIDFTASEEHSLHDELLEQIINYELTKQQYKLVRYLILNINEHGYLTVTNEEVYDQLGVTCEEVEKAKKLIHKLEPAGIGASDLSECLAIQARKEYPNNQLLVTLINNYLQALADKQWNRIAKELNISLARVKDLYETIQTLNPRPASSLATTRIDYVNPDIFIEKREGSNTFSVSLSDYYLPDIKYNHSYSNELMKTNELSQYVNDHYKKYKWLLNSIEQRRTTILKIMEVIINHQQAFLNNGTPSSLKALTLKDVANEIGMHESTVSRATANKLVETPAGTFELRYLFSTKLSTQSGKDTSQTKVKSIIEQMIDHENKYKPLSDQKIADELKMENGIVISRRTVAKYRDELQIPPSSKRKEIKI